MEAKGSVGCSYASSLLDRWHYLRKDDSHTLAATRLLLITRSKS